MHLIIKQTFIEPCSRHWEFHLEWHMVSVFETYILIVKTETMESNHDIVWYITVLIYKKLCGILVIGGIVLFGGWIRFQQRERSRQREHLSRGPEIWPGKDMWWGVAGVRSGLYYSEPGLKAMVSWKAASEAFSWEAETGNLPVQSGAQMVESFKI